ncbi:MAG: hypothetical protein ACFE8N_14250, partial [Promethearchaeota archaeon]
FYLFFEESKKTQIIDDFTIIDSQFNKRSNKIITGLAGIIPIVIISILRILLQSNILVGVLFLSCTSAFFMALGDIGITYLFNRINPADRRISKVLFEHAAIYGGIITLWIWF